MKNIASIFIAALVGSMITLLAYHYMIGGPQTVQVQSEARPAFANYLESPRSSANAAVAPFDFVTAAKKVTPAVVHITSTQGAIASNDSENDRRMQQIPEFLRDFFGDQFGGQLPQQGPRMGSGSGVIISPDGYVVTNNHVVADADELTVVLIDNRSYVAKVIGTDPTTDLALIKIDEKNLPALTLANSDSVRVGEWVMAAGNPFRGLNSTVTAGIVSAKGRNINILQQSAGQYAIESFIQTDAAVNPGNSGGALVNTDGDLVGINTAIASPTGSYAGYSFAIPTNIVKKVVEDLRKYGTVQRGFLGVMIRSVDAELAEEYDLNSTRGVLVDSLVADGSAKAAGIEEGDVIVQVDERTVNGNSDLLSYIGQKRPGDEVAVTVVRDGEEQTFNMTLKSQEGSTAIADNTQRNKTFSELGAEFRNLSKDELKEFGLDGGVQVTRAYPGKLRQQGVRPGFIITRIANQPVKSTDDLTEIIESQSGGVLIQGVYPDAPQETQYYGIGL